MKKLIAFSCIFVSLAALTPLAGCGGSGSSDDIPTNVALVGNGDSRSIRVSWKQPLVNDDSQLVEYQIFRSGTLVGTAAPNVTTFVDTTENRIVTYNNIVIRDGAYGEGREISQLTPVTAPVEGLKRGTYTYRVQGLYRVQNNVDSISHKHLLVLNQTEPITFE